MLPEILYIRNRTGMKYKENKKTEQAIFDF